QAWVFRRIRRRDYRRWRAPWNSTAAIDHHDPLRGCGRAISGPAVSGGDRTGFVVGRAFYGIRDVALPSGIRDGQSRLRSLRHPFRNPARRQSLNAGKICVAAARAAVRRLADWRDDCTLWRLCHTIRNGGGRGGPPARAGRGHLLRVGTPGPPNQTWIGPPRNRQAYCYHLPVPPRFLYDWFSLHHSLPPP